MEALIETGRTVIHIQNPRLIDLAMAYYEENREHLSPWEPLREEGYYSRPSFLARLEQAEASFRNDRTVELAALDRVSGRIAGVCSFTGIARGPFQACYLGYSIGRDYEGRGFMEEILRASLDYMSDRKKMHRIMANYMPGNKRSGKLLEKLGFEREGLARDYLKINGKWEDHILTSLIF